MYNLTKLKLLEVEKNSLQTILSQVGQLTELTKLRLSDIAGFHGVAKQLFDLVSLEVLHLNELKLQRLPTEMGRLTGLRKLILSKNPTLKSLPTQIGSLSRLTSLL